MNPANSSSSSQLEFTPDEMRRLGHAVVDALVERAEGLRAGAPWMGGSRVELEDLLREPCPEEPIDPDTVLRRARLDILPRAGRIDHPRFFAFVPSSPTWGSILGEMLATGYNIFQGTWLESAGPSQIELVVLDWFREWLEMPAAASGLFTSGGSAANLIAIVAAREAQGHPERPSVYMSEQSHSSIERACRIAGFRPRDLQKVACGPDYRLDLADLERRVAADRAAGRTPVLVAVNAGATNTGIVDPLPELAEWCRAQNLWLHVDGAYGGFAILSERGRAQLAGIGEADSVTLDPHKWLFQPYETGCLMVRDPADLQRAFRIMPEYLQDTDLGLEHVNFADRGLQLTRSFRALKVWMAMQLHGRRAHTEAITRSIELGDQAERWLREHPDFEVLSPASLGIVCFRWNSGDAATVDDQRLEEINRSIQTSVIEQGIAMMSSTRLDGRFSLRLCVMNHATRWSDVEITLEALARAARSAGAASTTGPASTADRPSG